MGSMSTGAKLLTLLRSGGAAFSPLSIPGLALWLDASDSATLFQDSAGTVPATADADPVGYWGDKSGAGRNATMWTADRRPLLKTAIRGGRNILRFDGTDDTMRLLIAAPIAQPITVWVVAQRTTTGFILSSEGGPFTFYGSSTRINAGTVLIDSATTITDWNVYTLAYNGASSAIRSNGVQRVAGDAGASSLATNLFISSNLNFNFWAQADVAEIILAPSPSAGLNLQVEAYLMAKWGF